MVLESVQFYPPKIASISNVQWTNIASEFYVWGRGQALQVSRNVQGTDITSEWECTGDRHYK